MFNSFTEVERFLDSQGIRKADPLSQSLANARHTQHLYLKFLCGEHDHRPTTKFVNLHGADGQVHFSITYPIQQVTTLPIVYIRGAAGGTAVLSCHHGTYKTCLMLPACQLFVWILVWHRNFNFHRKSIKFAW